MIKGCNGILVDLQRLLRITRRRHCVDDAAEPRRIGDGVGRAGQRVLWWSTIDVVDRRVCSCTVSISPKISRREKRLMEIM